MPFSMGIVILFLYLPLRGCLLANGLLVDTVSVTLTWQTSGMFRWKFVLSQGRSNLVSCDAAKDAMRKGHGVSHHSHSIIAGILT